MIYDRHDFAKVRFAVYGLSLAAWMAIAATSLGSGPALQEFLCSSSQVPWLTTGWVLSTSLHWLLMVVAMMVPMTLPAVAHIRVSTFVSRRLRATLLFWLGFVAIWLALGLAMKALQFALIGTITNSYGSMALVALVVCIWQFSPFKQRFLNRCHTHRSLLAFGFDADFDVFRFGLEQGWWCTGACWALMLLTIVLHRWHLAGMIIVSVFVFCERLDIPRYPAWRLTGLLVASHWIQRKVMHVGRRKTAQRKTA
jgi:predicted metal-binding membrane protein